ncbi:MAG: DUF72 domain-containing protein [Gemmatimonadota bacterium]|nr:DUF72 domain-containing protein [Gemmatimonadota bacterium]
MHRSQTDLFSGEHAALERSAVAPAPASPELQELAGRLPPRLRLGTSSWSFPGWAGIVYDRRAPESLLARKGLEPYARHPLLRAVGVDRTFYEPLPTLAFREYADAVPADFRFVVKADRRLTIPHLAGPDHPFGAPPPPGEREQRVRARGGIHSANPLFLDAEYARRAVVEPVQSGLGARLAVLLLQFPPLDPAIVGGPGAFAGRLRQFLARMPSALTVAVEVRTPALLTAAYRDALEAYGAVHAFTVHPTMPPLRQQQAQVSMASGRPLVVRWMLGHGLSYEDARDRYAPFDALVAEDVTARRWIADLVGEALDADRDAYVIVNNKAEGSSPLSIVKLARLLAREASA